MVLVVGDTEREPEADTAPMPLSISIVDALFTDQDSTAAWPTVMLG